MMNALEISGLSKIFKGFQLEKIDLELPQGYIMGLVGRNGAGKTTLFRAIMNMIRIDAGTIKILSHDHRAAEHAAKESIGYVSDVFPYGLDLSLQQISKVFARMFTRWEPNKFEALCENFQLDLSQKAGGLSKGMQTKFDLALALSHDAQLILLDEPSAGLDPIARREILDILRTELQDEGKSVLFSTHVTSDLDGIADYLTLLHDGRIILSEQRDVMDHSWRIVKLPGVDKELVQEPQVMAKMQTTWGMSLLVSDIEKIQAGLPADAITEPVSFEEIMIHMLKGKRHA